MAEGCPVCGGAAARSLGPIPTDTFGPDRTFEHLECPACGMVRVSPLPSAADLTALYTSPRYYALTETEALLPTGDRDRPRWKVLEFDRMLARVLPRRPPPARVLDVGCGWGLFMERAKAAGYDPEGLDPSPEVVDYVKDRLGLPARVGGIEDVEPGTFGVLALNDVLEHVRDPVGTLRMARRALAPGGVVLIRVPNYAGLTNGLIPEWLARARGRREPVLLQHLSEFRGPSLARALREAGFTHVRVGGEENLRRYYRKPPLKRLAWQALSVAALATGRPCALIGVGTAPGG